ncbi:MAG: DUF4159 domain-containing protein [Planctomycetota bacterium]|nr:DUF4159 domain-containing protein [Planctomycetota bacterium]
MRKSLFVFFLFFWTMALLADFKPPQGTPERRKGGEAFPPLPLPATPLRRTEKKRQPAPPVLVARLIHGNLRTVTYEGKEYKFWDWDTNPGAVKRLLKIAKEQLGVEYTETSISFERFDSDPAKNPILVVTGHMPLSFKDDEIEKLRKFTLAGGYVIFETCCGVQEFYDSAKEVVKKMFPDRKIVRLGSDHPLFRSHFPITSVTYNFDGKRHTVKEPPYVEGVDIGCRTAVFIFKYGILNGWDRFHDPGAKDFEYEDADQLGINLLAYALSYYALGRFIAQERVFFEEAKSEEGAFIFAQLVYEGNWDPNPTATLNLLASLKTASPALTHFKRVQVDLKKTDISRYPFLFLTGHDEFSFSKEEVEKLRNHIVSGGFLIADSCCARDGFTKSFISLIKTMFPDSELKHLPAEHPVYSSKFKIERISYTNESEKVKKDLPPLPLYGVEVNGVTRILFCPFSLGNGWEKERHPFTLGISPEDSIKLGVNIVTYCLTH